MVVEKVWYLVERKDVMLALKMVRYSAQKTAVLRVEDLVEMLGYEKVERKVWSWVDRRVGCLVVRMG